MSKTHQYDSWLDSLQVSKITDILPHFSDNATVHCSTWLITSQQMTYDNTDAIGSTAQLAHISLVRPLEFRTMFTKTDRIDFIDKYWLSMTERWLFSSPNNAVTSLVLKQSTSYQWLADTAVPPIIRLHPLVIKHRLVLYGNMTWT